MTMIPVLLVLLVVQFLALAALVGYVQYTVLREVRGGHRLTQLILEQLPGFASLIQSSRNDVRHVADEQVALAKANDLFGKYLAQALEEMRSERKKPDEPPADGTGDIAMSRMARTRQYLSQLEAQSYAESLKGEKA